MSRNHRNRSWRAQWEMTEVRGAPVARHRSGVVAMVVEGEVLVDTTQFQGTHFAGDEIYLRQARRLMAERDEPDPQIDAPSMS